MNGRNASGRPVSLLNDDDPRRGWTTRSKEPVPPLSPGTDPPTPDLWRSGSCSSRLTTGPSSPTTPADLDEDPLRQATVFILPSSSSGPSFGARPTHHHHHHPPLPPPLRPKQPDPTSMPNRVRPTVDTTMSSSGSSPSPTAETPKTTTMTMSSSSSSSSSLSVSAKPMPKRYPCQFADSLDCREMFTTSGHASRHAKRHTGEKNVRCPRCPKRFARKDNMKQHLKTHEGGGRGGHGHRTSTMAKTGGHVDSRSSSLSLSPSPSLSSSSSLPTTTTTTMTAANKLWRPPLHRSSATHDVPRRDLFISTSTSIPPTSSMDLETEAEDEDDVTSIIPTITDTTTVSSPLSSPLSPPFSMSSSRQQPQRLRQQSPSALSSSPSYPPPLSPWLTPGLDALVLAADRHHHQRTTL